MLESLTEFKNRGGNTVVVDTGSHDKTAQVARDWGCIVEEVGDRFRLTISEEQAKAINEKFIVNGEEPVVKGGDSLFDFSSARNYAASLSPTDMIAMPDCDEMFTKLDIDKINEAIEKGAEQFEYQFVFSHDQFGNPMIAFLHSKFYNRTKLEWTGIIHEVLRGAANRVYLPEDTIKLEHYQNQETNRTGYLKGLALDCFLHPDSDRNSHYFAREMMYTKRYHSAIKEFERHVEMKKWLAERAQSVVYIGECYDRLGQENMAVSAWQEAYNMDSSRREPLIRLMQFYFYRGDAPRVVAYGEAALTIPKGNFYSDNAAHYREWPHDMLYWAYWKLGNKEKSKEHWQKCLEYQPESPKYKADAQFYVA